MVNTRTIIVTDFPILYVICFKDSNFALTIIIDEETSLVFG